VTAFFTEGFPDGLRVAYAGVGGPRRRGRTSPTCETSTGCGASYAAATEQALADHRLLLTLADYAQTNGVHMEVHAIPPFAARLIDLLPASYLRLAEVGTES
jgi:hypothetical protein